MFFWTNRWLKTYFIKSILFTPLKNRFYYYPFDHMILDYDSFKFKRSIKLSFKSKTVQLKWHFKLTKILAPKKLILKPFYLDFYRMWCCSIIVYLNLLTYIKLEDGFLVRVVLHLSFSTLDLILCKRNPLNDHGEMQ